MKIYDSKVQELVEFIPYCDLDSNDDKKVGIYVCGPTVQSSPHIGHMRSAVAFDIIRKYLEYKGYCVNFVQNVTDIDDKILNKSSEAGVHWKQHAQKYAKEFSNAYQSLNIMSPTATPYATKYIGSQIKMINQIISNGYAYRGEGANVWFNTSKFSDYGELTKQNNDDNTEVSDEDYRTDKINPRDFALWKGGKDSDPQDALWDSPWGKGRPGWHIECSAMAYEILGEKFDIHGGGLDLRFPHHENELAQSKAAGKSFAKYWMHSAWVTSKGEKMSKSLGNGLNVSEVCQNKISAFALRYALSVVHYRSMLEWSDQSLISAMNAAKKWYKLLKDAEGDISNYEVPKSFANALDSDFNVSQAVASLFDLVKTVDKNDIKTLFQIRKALSILGVDPLDKHWDNIFVDVNNADGQFSQEEKLMIQELVDRRQKAKAEKNFTLADQIRDELLSKGIKLVDTPSSIEYLRI